MCFPYSVWDIGNKILSNPQIWGFFFATLAKSRILIYQMFEGLVYVKDSV